MKLKSKPEKRHMNYNEWCGSTFLLLMAVLAESLRPHTMSEPPWKSSTSCFPDNPSIEFFSHQASAQLWRAEVIKQFEDDDASPGGGQEVNWS